MRRQIKGLIRETLLLSISLEHITHFPFCLCNIKPCIGLICYCPPGLETAASNHQKGWHFHLLNGTQQQLFALKSPKTMDFKFRTFINEYKKSFLIFRGILHLLALIFSCSEHCTVGLIVIMALALKTRKFKT